MLSLRRAMRLQDHLSKKSYSFSKQCNERGALESEIDHIEKFLEAHFAWDLLGGRFFACKERDLSFEKVAILKRLHLQEMRETTLELFSSGYRNFC